MGTNVLYLPGYYSGGKLKPINYPFFIGLDKSIHYFKPKQFVYDSVILLRKSGFLPYRDTRWKKKTWVDNLNEGEFQASNDSLFNNPTTLAKLDHFNSTHIQKIILSNKNDFKYVRFYDKKESYLALLEFLDINGKKISGQSIKNNKTLNLQQKEGAFDDDSLTYSGGSEFSLGLKLDVPQPLGAIRFQARNDDNHIRIGDQYELLYWDKLWKSLGQKTATDTLLVYNSVVPKNSLLWLRNLSRGKEENAFTMDDIGQKQIWLGFYY